MLFDLAPTLDLVVNLPTLKWVFVGGKGGVGKTTTSCLVAIRLALAHPEEQILLISTDPAHNLSDAFNQKFGKDALPVTGLANLLCMEIDPELGMADMAAQAQQQFNNDPNDPLGGMFKDMTGSIPGIDEALLFMEVLKHIRQDDGAVHYRTIVFDTAPTGHTLRFLQLPSTLDKLLGKLQLLSGRFAPMLSMMGGSQQQTQEMLAKLTETQTQVAEVNTQFQNPDLTTFVPVCIAEFLSLYETERMIQELMLYNMDVNSIVVNQLLFGSDGCRRCAARWQMQQKYLGQMAELYEDYHVVKMPLLGREVRGLANLKVFSGYLLKAYDPEVDGDVVYSMGEA